jgi:asparagine synthase (glutamine-hydrolysing)
MFILSKLVRDRGYKVSTGEGSDEILGGYDIFKEVKVRFLAARPESRIRPLLLPALSAWITSSRSPRPTCGRSSRPRRKIWPARSSRTARWSTSKFKLFYSADLRAELSYVTAGSAPAASCRFWTLAP